jgi:hypothetical protein
MRLSPADERRRSAERLLFGIAALNVALSPFDLPEPAIYALLTVTCFGLGWSISALVRAHLSHRQDG